MDNYNKNWRKNFDEKAKSGSSNLVPSERIFEHVKNSVFEKKKKRRFLWLWSGVGLFILVSGWFAIGHFSDGDISNNASEPTEKMANQSPQSTLEKKVNRASLDRPNNGSIETYDHKSSIAQITEPKNKNLLDNETPNNADTYTNSVSVDRKSEPYHSKSKAKAADAAAKVPFTRNNGSYSKQMERLLFEKQSKRHSPASSQDFLMKNTSGKSQNDNNRLESFNQLTRPVTNSDGNRDVLFRSTAYLDLISLKHITFSQEITPSFVPSPSIRVNQRRDDLHWNLEFGMMYLSWDDRLNSNYQAVLNPADFYATSKSGFGVYSRLGKSITKRLSFGIGAGINFVRSSSGHNSTLAYDIENETIPFSLNENLTLATPYGLIESNVSFKRSATTVDNQQLSLGVMTDHSFNNYFLDLSMHYDLIQSKKWECGMLIGPRVNILSRLDNELSFALINGAGVSIEQFQLIKSQEHVNSSFVSIVGQLDVSYQLNTYWHIVLAGSWSEGLTPIFENNSLGSTARTMNVSIGLGRKF